MTPRTWICKLFASQPTRRNAATPFRRSLDVLEGREVPAVMFDPVSQVILTNGKGISFAELADFTGDGKLDVVTANNAGNTYGYAAGVGNGSFGTAIASFSGGGGPAAVAVKDFNGDGKLDVAIANSTSNNVGVALGTGAGYFGAARVVGTGSGPVDVAAGDFNGDGKADLATANFFGNNVGVLLGHGDGSFQAAAPFGTGAGTRSVEAADVNGDGKLDLVTANNRDNTVSVLLGNGNGTFQGAVNYGVGLMPSSVAVGDFNGDGRLDLAAANAGGNSISYLQNNGNGTFLAVGGYVAGSPGSIAAGDFNLDGKLDLVATNSNGNAVTVLQGNGDGTFQSPVAFAAGAAPRSVAAGDLNADGKPDLVVANGLDGRVSVLMNAFNTAPTVARNLSAVAVNEGTPVANSGTFGDAQGNNTVTLTASLGSVTKNDLTGTWDWTYDAADNTVGPDAVTITAADDRGATDTTMFKLTVHNVAPTLTSYAVQAAGVEGAAVALNATATDPAGANDPLTYTWTVTRADAAPVTLSGASAAFAPTGSGSHTVTLTVTDGDGGTVRQTSNLTVYSLAAGQKFVRSLYTNELGRPASSAEVSGWVNVLGGPGGQSAVAAGVANSTEARARVVTGWFRTHLGRSPSPSETSAYVAALATQSQEQVLSGIVGSTEFFSRAQAMGFGGTADQNYVSALYRSLLGRGPSNAELTAQVGTLQQVGPSALARSVMNSVEYRANVVRGYYSSLLRRAASPAEVASWVNGGLDVRAIRTGIESSLEYFVHG